MDRAAENGKNSARQLQVDDHSILVIRFSSIGDILLTTPVLRALRQKWPKGRISFLTKERFAPLLQGNPHVDELLTLKEGAGVLELYRLGRSLARRRWHILADLHSSTRSSLIRRIMPADFMATCTKSLLKRSLLIYTRLDLYGPEPPSVPERYAACMAPYGVCLDQGPCELYLDHNDRSLAEKQIVARWPDSPNFLALAPGAAWPTKRWPAERFAQAAAELASRHELKVILLGSGKDLDACEQVGKYLGQKNCLNLAGRLPLRGSAAAVEKSRILLTNDTGLMHIATAVGTPVVAIFGCTTRHLGYFPYRAGKAKVIETNLYCRPCTHNGRKRCPLGHFRCMKDIGAEMVLEAAEGLLNE